MIVLMENPKQCSSCSHYHPDSNDAGECHLNPPLVSNNGGFGNWPGVRASDWCGKFRPKSEPSRQPGRPQLYTEEGLLTVVTPLIAGKPMQFSELHKLICLTTPMHGLTAKKRLDGLVISGKLNLTESGYSLPVIEEDFS